MAERSRLQTWLLWIAVIRIAVGVAAIPLAPLLFRDHFVLLVLMRPTKEVLLAGGWLLREGEVTLVELVIASIPLSVIAVWLFFWLGLAYSGSLRDGKLPGIGNRVLRPEGVVAIQGALRQKGARLVPIGRIAAFSSATVGVAAGAAGMSARTFILADLVGAAASLALSIGSGYALGEAYKSAGPWLAAFGLGLCALVVVMLGRYLRKVDPSPT